MSIQTAAFPQISIAVEREEIPMQAMSPDRVPDERWRYVDKQGHGHFWQGKELPTLEWVVTGTAWVGDEYGGEEYEIGEWRCLICAEVVEPKLKDKWPGPIFGPTWVTLTVNGESFKLTTEEYAKSLDSWLKALRKFT